MLRLDALENFFDLKEIIPERRIAQRFGKALPDGMVCGLLDPDIGNPRRVKFGIEIAQPERALILRE